MAMQYLRRATPTLYFSVDFEYKRAMFTTDYTWARCQLAENLNSKGCDRCLMSQYLGDRC